MNLFYQPQIDQGIHYLDEEESRHCIKVLRRRAGDQLQITDGKGFFYHALITDADPRRCSFNIREQRKENEKTFTIHIAISPTKNADRIEWFVEKTVEIGIDQITLLDCKNSERSFIKTDRLKKVAISAMKQSIKATLPVINDMISFDTFIQHREEEKFIAFVDMANPLHLKDAAKSKGKYLVLIGPEGDFSNEELDAATALNFTKVSLGKSRLRTETAGIAACHLLNLIND